MKKIIIYLVISGFTFAFAFAQVTSQKLDIPTTTVHAIDGSAWSSCVGTSLLTGNVYWVYNDSSLNAVIAKKRLLVWLQRVFTAIMVVDAKGAIVQSLNTENYQVSIPFVIKGIYLLRFQSGTKTTTTKVAVH
ncbi:MAG: T9SS type A sorting domain-containing protein [Paludibacter sp.]